MSDDPYATINEQAQRIQDLKADLESEEATSAGLRDQLTELREERDEREREWQAWAAERERAVDELARDMGSRP